MPVRSRVVTKDEELGKRDDDFRPKSGRALGGWLLPWRWRRRRVILMVVLIAVVYLLVQNTGTDFRPLEERLIRDFRTPYPNAPTATTAVAEQVPTEEPDGAPPREVAIEEDDKAKQYYNGPIRFYKLGDTLHSIVYTMGTRASNRNVLFAASSLRSTANLLPLACAMAERDRNYVHFAIFGRSTLTMENILEVNGLGKDDCKVFFHDARGDYPEYSSDYRAEFSVAGGMKHVYDYMHPQALVVDDSSIENEWFTRPMRKKSQQMGRPIIEIPSGRYEDFFWITRLDSAALANFFKPTIEIVIQAPHAGSGSLIRLLRSLVNADYSGFRFPKLTIELPSQVERSATLFLSDLKWPPNRDNIHLQSDLLTIRHRIPSPRMSSEQASLRFLESFYPSDPQNNHILILSPQAELNPQYFKYLHFMILQMRHVMYGLSATSVDEVMGISLDVPSRNLDRSRVFSHPTAANITRSDEETEGASNDTSLVPFLYQAPSSAATLIFGDKWVTLHSFLSRRLEASHLGKARKHQKLVSEVEPAWMEYTLELMRANGWTIVHPESSLVTVHDDLAQIPEEYDRSLRHSQGEDLELPQEPEHPEEEAFLTAEVPPVLPKHDESRDDMKSVPLHQLLTTDDDIAALYEMPFLSHEGELLTGDDVDKRKRAYANFFRTSIGGCTASQTKRLRLKEDLKADDLFCLPGMTLNFIGDDEAETDIGAGATQSPTHSSDATATTATATATELATAKATVKADARHLETEESQEGPVVVEMGEDIAAG